MYEVEDITLAEYFLRMKAYRLRQVDKTYDMATEVWLNRKVNSTNKDGKYIYTDFKTFFDYDQAQNDVLKPQKSEKEMDPDLVKIAKKLQRFQQKNMNERR